MTFCSIISNAGRPDECRRQKFRRRHRGFRVCESAVADAEPADEFQRNFPDFLDVDALCNDDASRAADTVALPKRQSGRAGHQCARTDVLYELSPEPESKHLFTLHDYAQSECVAGN